MDSGIQGNDFDKLSLIRVLTVVAKIIYNTGTRMFIERPTANPKQKDSP